MGRKSAPPPYAELHAASAFSFLDGASLPEDLVERAAALELPAVALVDANGVYAAPRFHQAAKQAGIKALVGAEVALEDEPSLFQKRARLRPPRPGARARSPTRLEPRGSTPRPGSPCSPPTRPATATSAGSLTAAARGRAKGEARVSWDLLAEHAAGLHCLTGGDEGPLARELAEGGIDPARRLLERLGHLFPGRLHVELQRHRLREEEHRNQALVDLARRLRLPLARHQRRALRARGGQAAARRAHGHPPPHHPRRRGPAARRPPRAALQERRRDGPRCSPTSPRRSPAAPSLAERARLHAGRPRLPLPRVPAAARRDAGLLPAPRHLERRPRPLPAADGARPRRRSRRSWT